MVAAVEYLGADSLVTCPMVVKRDNQEIGLAEVAYREALARRPGYTKARVNLAKCFPELSAVEREALLGRALMDIGRTFTESACAWIWPAPARVISSRRANSVWLRPSWR